MAENCFSDLFTGKSLIRMAFLFAIAVAATMLIPPNPPSTQNSLLIGAVVVIVFFLSQCLFGIMCSTVGA